MGAGRGAAPLRATGTPTSPSACAAAEAAMGPEDLRARGRRGGRAAPPAGPSPTRPRRWPRCRGCPWPIIGPAPVEPAVRAWQGARPCPACATDIPTRGIAYAYRYFDLGRATRSRSCPTWPCSRHRAGQAGHGRATRPPRSTRWCNGRLGSLSFFADMLRGRRRRALICAPKLVVARASALSENVDAPACELPLEIMLETDFSDAGQDQGRAAAAAHRHGAGLRRSRPCGRHGARGIVLPAGRRRARAAGRRGFLPLPQGPARALRRARRTSWLHAWPTLAGRLFVRRRPARWASPAPTTTSSASGSAGGRHEAAPRSVRRRAAGRARARGAQRGVHRAHRRVLCGARASTAAPTARPTRARGRWRRARCPTTSCGTRCA